MNIVSVKNVFKSFNCHKVLEDISLNIRKGESFVIMGNSGSGKSILIKILVGMVMPDKGKVYINDNLITENIVKNVISNDISFGFQNDALFDSLSIKDNLILPLVKRRKLNKAEALDIAINELYKVGLDKKIANLYPNELSGGMRKRVAVLRTLIIKPKIAIFDEPTTGLDPITTDKINLFISDHIKKYKNTIITITHSIKCMNSIANRVLFLLNGKNVWHGDISKLPEVENKDIQSFIS